MWKKFKQTLKIFGPGVITGAADDDPSGIATYSQAGAQFGAAVLWLNIAMLPFQAGVQEACARIGAVTGKGIAEVIKKHYSKKVLYIAVILVLIANTVNIGADIGAMAEALNMVVALPLTVWMLLLTALILILEIFVSYQNYAKMLKWFALSLLLYPLTMLLVVRGNGAMLWSGTVIPKIVWSFPFLFIVTGVIGTTISPYMFFWQAAEEIEEEKESHLWRRLLKPRIGIKFIKRLRIDNIVGMFMSGFAAWAIMALAAIVLFPNGITDIKTAADAAKALEPLVAVFPNAGYLAKVLFASGIISLGFLSIPVLSGSAAYALSEAMGWKEGLSLKLSKAHGFYGAITISTLIGLCINYIGIDPMKALVYSAVLNAIVAVPLLFLIASVAQDKKIMGKYRSGWLSKILLWSTFVGMLLAGLGTIFTLGMS